MLRIALVGVGLASKRHIESAAVLKDEIKISACIDMNLDRAREVAQNCGAKAFQNLTEALPHCDVVILCTPPAFRREMAIEAMKAGKHVMLEKPLCMTLEDGQAIVECAKETGVLVTMGFNNRFRKGFKMLKEDIDSGRLGKIQSFYIHRQGMGLVRENVPSWRNNASGVCGHAIESLSHDLDVLRFCVGEVKSVKALVLDTLPYAPGYDNNAVVCMELANGALANLYSCWSSPLAYNNRGAIGSEGAAYVSGTRLWNLDTYCRRTVSMDHDEVITIDDPLSADCYIEEHKAFIGAIKGNNPLATTVEDGYKVLQLSHAILESSRTGDTVYLD